MSGSTTVKFSVNSKAIYFSMGKRFNADKNSKFTYHILNIIIQQYHTLDKVFKEKDSLGSPFFKTSANIA